MLNKFIEEGEITKKPKSVKKAPIKNAKAFLTSSFPQEIKSESQKANKHDSNTLHLLPRFSSSTSKANENILEVDTLKSLSKESRTKNSNPQKCKKKSNLVNYLGKSQNEKVKHKLRPQKLNENGEAIRPHTAHDYLIKQSNGSSKKSDKLIKPRIIDGGNRFIKSSKSRMTSELVDLINQTKKDVENLRASRRNSNSGVKSNSK